MEQPNQANLIKSRQTGNLLEHIGYLFNRDRFINQKSGDVKFYWGCLKRNREKCPCRLITNRDHQVLSIFNEHSHEAEPALAEKYKLEALVKQRIRDSKQPEESLEKIIESELAQFSDRLRELLQLPKFVQQMSLFRKRRKYKRKADIKATLKKQAELNPNLGIHPSLYQPKSIQYFNPGIEPVYVHSLKSFLPTNLDFHGYLFIRDRRAEDKDYWRCYERQKIKCPARLKTEDNKIVCQIDEHNHLSDPLFVDKMKLDFAMRQDVCQTNENIKDIITRYMESNEHLADLYNLSNLKHLLTRVRTKHRRNLEAIEQITSA